MARSQKSVTLRSVRNRNKGGDISQAPEMKELVEVNREMTEEEKEHTKQYLKDRDSRGEEPREVIQ
jgi:hypothetical protein